VNVVSDGASGSLASRDRFLGCLLAGAVGDALGAPVEFETLDEIRGRLGAAGVTGLIPGVWPAGTITDDTQMTLFTAEGLLRADVRGSQRGVCWPPGVVMHAYSRWAVTQGIPARETVAGREWDGFEADGWHVRVDRLFARRAPGHTCMSALTGSHPGSVAEPLNESKGCGGVMRAAPAGLMPIPWGDAGEMDTFARGATLAAITHGHPSGYLAAGYLAHLVEQLRVGHRLDQALDSASARLSTEREGEEVARAVAAARELSTQTDDRADSIRRLGEGWVAEEALAIAIYATLSTPTLVDALLLAVNHDGDSDSTGAITGNIAGTLYGHPAIPRVWLDQLELRIEITRIADDLFRCAVGRAQWDAEAESTDYPGW
jgi:ADP-ribosyl-[dinitrogen reductase] hydrolase